jgi:hypothetical protein
MPSVDEVAGQIATAGVPALFLDTCILLDVIRSTLRCLSNYAALTLELLKLISASPPACMVVVSSIVPHEWNANAQTVTDEIVRHLKKLEEHSSHFHDACQALGIALPSGRISYSQTGLAERLHDLSRQILDRALALDPDDASRLRAVTRVVYKAPPAQKSSEVKDCALLEEYLAVCRRLQAAGCAGKRVFCTSNTADYCLPTGKPHPTLEAELAACGLIFTANLPWALHELTH